jgi:hypothetical protein
MTFVSRRKVFSLQSLLDFNEPREEEKGEEKLIFHNYLPLIDKSKY